jgi:hypothetical protein
MKYAGYATCHLYHGTEEFNDCLEQAGTRFLRMATPWWGIVVADALSIGALWLLAWIALVVGRWVAAGFLPQA